MNKGDFMKIIVCDDNTQDRGIINSHIKKYFKENSCPVDITAYAAAELFLKDWNENKLNPSATVKIAFLDIYMPGISGIELAKEIRKTDEGMVIIFTTSSVDHGLDGYSVKALQYLVKPVAYSEVEDILNECMARFAESLRYIEVMSERLAVKILLKDILFIETFDHDCLFHTAENQIKSRLTLDEIQRQLDGSTFLKTHRSYIVNMRYIKSISENDFVLTNGTMIPIRRNDRLAVKQAYMDYLFELRRGK
jgi:DNA-binding LytR/AlgR family response regulator